jgi:CBS domain-containing protein
VELLDWVQGADDTELLDDYARRVADAARQELDSGAGALEAGRAIATFNDALTRRLIGFAEAELGPPPCPYAWLALGSQGRQEQSLFTDQDNALAYAANTPANTPANTAANTATDTAAINAAAINTAAISTAAHPPEADTYLAALAKRVVEGLNRAGLVYCPGGYMATNWRRTLPDWQATFRAWLDRPSSPGVVEAEVFLDFRPVSGELDLEPLEAVLRTSPDRPRFLILMARAAVTFRPPLRFGRLHGRQVDLKKGGLAAIVLLARLYALAGRSAARATRDRLRAAVETGQLTEQGAVQLTEAYGVLFRLRLDSQLRAAAAGHPPSNVVSVKELNAGDRSRLTDAFRVVREHQQLVEMRFHTEMIS